MTAGGLACPQNKMLFLPFVASAGHSYFLRVLSISKVAHLAVNIFVWLLFAHVF